MRTKWKMPPPLGHTKLTQMRTWKGKWSVDGTRGPVTLQVFTFYTEQANSCFRIKTLVTQGCTFWGNAGNKRKREKQEWSGNRDEVRMERGRCHCAPRGTNAAYLWVHLYLPKTAPNIFFTRQANFTQRISYRPLKLWVCQHWYLLYFHCHMIQKYLSLGQEKSINLH